MIRSKDLPILIMAVLLFLAALFLRYKQYKGTGIDQGVEALASALDNWTVASDQLFKFINKLFRNF